MESLQQIQRRRKSVQNIGTITKAMELVSATKMRRSQSIALASRPYAVAALELLERLSREELPYLPQLLEHRTVQSRLIVLITSDKGLAGAFNGNVLKAFDAFLKKNNNSSKNSFLAVGQRAHDYLIKNNLPENTSFTHFADYTTAEEIRPLTETILNGYLAGQWDEVIIFSTHFINALKQKVVEQKILPVEIPGLRKIIDDILPNNGHLEESSLPPINEKAQEYLIEPTPHAVLEKLLPHVLEMEIYHIMLEANASEHSARRLAMQNASDNASDLNEELTLIYNKSRQATITREIIEISSGAESLKTDN